MYRDLDDQRSDARSDSAARCKTSRAGTIACESEDSEPLSSSDNEEPYTANKENHFGQNQRVQKLEIAYQKNTNEKFGISTFYGIP